MARSLGTLTLDVIAKTASFVQGMDKAERSANKFQKNLKKQNDDISNSFAGLTARIAGPLAAALSVREVVRYADEWTNLTNRLKLVTDSSQELALAQSDVFNIAQETRQSLSSSAELYQRIAGNADNLGLSLSEVAGVVKTISQTLVISGTSAQGASAALVQLGQAFASGTLRGEELNSVLEQAPALAQAIAEGLGKTTGELRALGAAGLLTSDQVIEALQKMAGSIDEDFGKTVGTVGDAFTKLGNSLVNVTGRMDAATGASAGLAGAISYLADEIDRAAEGDGLDDQIKQVERFLEAARNVRDSSGIGNVLGDLGSKDNNEQVAEHITKLKQLRAERDLLANQKPVDIEVNIDMETLKTSFEQAGQSVEQYGKKASDAAQKVQDSYKDQVQNYQRQISLINATTEAERTRFETTQGSLSTLDASQKKNIENLSKELDLAQKRKDVNESYKSQVSSYEQQIALTGEVSEAERARYETSKGSLSELDEAQKRHIETLAQEVDAIKKLNELNESYSAQVESYEREIALSTELTELEKVRYEIAHGTLQGLTEQQQQRLEGLAAEKDAIAENAEIEQEIGALKADLMTEEEAAWQRRAEAMDLLSRANEEQLEALGGFAEASKRVMDQYDEDMKRATDATDEWSEFTKNAAKNMQDAFADFLFDPFKDGLDGLANNFAKILQRMAAEAAAAAIFENLFGSTGGSGGGGNTGWLAGLFSLDGGGSTGSGPRSGGLDGKGGFLAMVHPNETMIDHTKSKSHQIQTMLQNFDGFFDTGGRIGANRWGIAGERGMEIIQGPATVTSTKETSRLLEERGNSISIGQMSFPGVRNAREATEAAGAAARQLARITSSGQRYS